MTPGIFFTEHQLSQVFVRTDYGDGHALVPQSVCQRPDNVIGLGDECAIIADGDAPLSGLVAAS